jgi:hypothetical protein
MESKMKKLLIAMAACTAFVSPAMAQVSVQEMMQDFAITDIVVMNIYRENCVTPNGVPWNVVDENVKYILVKIPDGKARYAQVHDGLMASPSKSEHHRDGAYAVP